MARGSPLGEFKANALEVFFIPKIPRAHRGQRTLSSLLSRSLATKAGDMTCKVWTSMCNGASALNPDEAMPACAVPPEVEATWPTEPKLFTIGIPSGAPEPERLVLIEEFGR